MTEQKIDQISRNKDNLDITEVIDMPENLNQKVSSIQIQKQMFDKSDDNQSQKS